MTPPPRERASVLTPPGRGAVAVVAAEGAAALASVAARFRAVNGRPLAEQPIGRIVFGHWHDDDAAGEEVIVVRTSPWVFEVHCHGGVAASARIVDALARGGCQVEPWQDWVRSAAACPIQAEADVALTAAATRRTAAILLDQRRGALRRAVEEVRQQMAANHFDAARELLGALDARAALGRRLAQPWVVAIAGRPNVGKSSLVNALVGYQRAIVFGEPGTTRDVLDADTAFDGWPVRLTDAAGLRETTDPLEAEGVARARGQLQGADLVVWVLDAGRHPHKELADAVGIAEHELAAEAPGLRLAADPLVVVNKVDLASADLRRSPGAAWTSALTGAGVDELAASIARRLVPHPPAPGEPAPFTQRQIDLLASAADQLQAGQTAAARVELDHLLGE